MPASSSDTLNIAEYFLDRRIDEGLGARTALIVGDRRFTYAEVHDLATRVGEVLVELGARQEERIVIALPDGMDYVAAFFGTLKIGAVVVMVNPQLPPAEIAALCDYCRASVAIVDSELAAALDAERGEDAWPRRLLTIGSSGTPHPDLEERLAGTSGDLETVATHRDDPAVWLFSGGTTGRPKAVVQPHASFVNTTELYAQRFLGYHQDDITLSVPKLYFGYATGSNLLFPFSVGAAAILYSEPPTAEVLFELIAAHRPTILINVPTMVSQMLNHPAAGEQDFSSLRFSTSAGEALPAPLYHRWRETFGAELLDGLGTAEMWHIFLSNRPGEVFPGTLGRPVPGFEIRVADDAGESVPDGEVGRLWVRGDSLALGYWQAADKTAEAFRGEWFVGGDLVCRDAEGLVTYCGRGDDAMKVGGRWLVPQEVESCLCAHPEVRECAVVGVENESGLTKPMAFVVATERRDGLEEELKQFVLDRLAPYKHPRRILLLDDFPRTHLGKIARGRLPDLLP